MIDLSHSAQGEKETGSATRDAYYLVDEDAVRGIGHAASLVENEEGGYTYLSYSTGDDLSTPSDNLETRTYSGLNEAVKDLSSRYEKYLRFETTASGAKSFVEAVQLRAANNCVDFCATGFRAANIQLEYNAWPRWTYRINKDNAASYGEW